MNDIPFEPVLPPAALAGLPATSAEATTAMIHYYRAEMSRMNAWRSRLDLTSNWAITVVAALLSVSLSTATAHHGLVLFAMLIILLLLCVEARRYRYYDVYRMRVRQFERHYFGQIFGPGSEAASDSGAGPWLLMLAQDLRHPKFRITFHRALRRRLRRNYIWMFVILGFAWLVKLGSPDLQPGASSAPSGPLELIIRHASIGPMPGWLVLALVLGFFVGLAVASLKGKDRGGDEVHV